MNINNDYQNCTPVQMKVPTDIPLWEYLLSGQKKSTRRHSRIEAFLDLMQRQYGAHGFFRGIPL